MTASGRNALFQHGSERTVPLCLQHRTALERRIAPHPRQHLSGRRHHAVHPAKSGEPLQGSRCCHEVESHCSNVSPPSHPAKRGLRCQRNTTIHPTLLQPFVTNPQPMGAKRGHQQTHHAPLRPPHLYYQPHFPQRQPQYRRHAGWPFHHPPHRGLCSSE